MIKISSIFFSLFIFIFYYIFLFDSIHSYFSQDDFFHLRLIMDKNLTDIPSFFVSKLEGQTFYRPLSREVLNTLVYRSFGFNPFPFHLINLMLIVTNTLLGFFLVKRLTNSFTLPLIAAILYALNPVHSIELYYLASVQTLLATAFILGSILLYIKARKSNLLNFYLASILLFLLALLSHEISVVLFPMLLLIEIFIFPNKISFKRLTPFLSLTLLYLATTFFDALPREEVYNPSFSLSKIINTLGWYTIWSFGLPEMLVDFVGPNFSLKINFIEWFGNYFWIATFCSMFIISSFLILVLRFKTRILDKYIFLFVLLFISSLGPFLFFPQHKFIYYLSLATFWFSGGLAFFLSLAWHDRHFKILPIIIITVFALLFYNTHQINKMTHWAAKRAQAAKVLMYDIKNMYPSVNRGVTFYIKNDPSYPNISKEWGSSSKQAFYILSGSDALRVLYNDSSIRAYYQDVNPPKDYSSLNITTASFPY